MIRKGLLADRAARTVRIWAESISNETKNPLEFLMITPGSGKNYEATSTSFASAYDTHCALEFIGLRAGHGVSQEALQFWPKGDRVKVTVHIPASSTNQACSVDAEKLVLNTRSGQPLPESGFVFIGSSRIPDPAVPTNILYAADAFSPGTIISLYNENSAVLDVPRRAAQSEVYSTQFPNPACPLPQGALIEFLLEPYYRDTLCHLTDYTLKILPGTATNTDYALIDAKGNTLNKNRSLNGILATLEALSNPEQELFVTICPNDGIQIGTLPRLAQLLVALDTEKGIRIEAPPKGHPYYKAFAPNPAHRRREGRPVLTSELHLYPTTANSATGEVIFLESTWQGDNAPLGFKETRIPLATPADLTTTLASHPNAPAIIMIFATNTLSYGTLRTYTEPLLKRAMILYVFLP